MEKQVRIGSRTETSISGMRKWVCTVAATALVVPLLVTTGGLSAAAAAPADALHAKDRQFIAAVEANPTDYAALDALSQKLFGTRYYVSFGESGTQVTGARASQMVAAVSTT